MHAYVRYGVVDDAVVADCVKVVNKVVEGRVRVGLELAPHPRKVHRLVHNAVVVGELDACVCVRVCVCVCVCV